MIPRENARQIRFGRPKTRVSTLISPLWPVNGYCFSSSGSSHADAYLVLGVIVGQGYARLGLLGID